MTQKLVREVARLRQEALATFGAPLIAVPNYAYDRYEFLDPHFLAHLRAGLGTALQDLRDYRWRAEETLRKYLDTGVVRSADPPKKLSRTTTDLEKLLDSLAKFEEALLELIAEIDTEQHYG